MKTREQCFSAGKHTAYSHLIIDYNGRYRDAT